MRTARPNRTHYRAYFGGEPKGSIMVRSSFFKTDKKKGQPTGALCKVVEGISGET